MNCSPITNHVQSHAILCLASFMPALVHPYLRISHWDYLTYAIVVMPGLLRLDDRAFIRAFQVTDSKIQNRQMVFMLVWLGSIFLVVCTMDIAFLILTGNIRWLIIVTGAVYLLGVQGITILIHLPLNDRIQSVRVDEVDDETAYQKRLIFEAKGNFLNRARTALGFCATAMFLLAVSVI